MPTSSLLENRALDYFQNIVETVREPLVILDSDLRVQGASRSFYRTFSVTKEETEGRLIYELGDRQWDIPALRTLLEEILPAHTEFDGFTASSRIAVLCPGHLSPFRPFVHMFFRFCNLSTPTIP